MARTPTSTTPGRFLIIRPSALGDVCKTVPIAASIRNAYPDATIDWLVQDSFADAIRHHPAINNCILFPRSRFRKWYHPSVMGDIRSFLSSLRKARYDAVIDCQGLARSGAFSFATRAPIRSGYADAREGAARALTHRVNAPVTMHTVDRMLRLLEPLRVQPVRDMSLVAPPEALAQLDADPQLSRRFALIAPTSRWAAKRWPADRFRVLAERMLTRCASYFDAIVVVGGPGERDQCSPLLELASSELRVVDRVGSGSIGDLMALVSRAQIVIANDSAPLHMAVGFDRPLVGLFGPTRVDRVGPYGCDSSVIQHLRDGDTFDHKLDRAIAMTERIEIEEVFAMVCEKLEAAVPGNTNHAESATSSSSHS